MARKTPRVAVIGTGGSISAPGRHSLDLFEYIEFSAPVEVDELIAMFPEVGHGVEVVPVRYRAIDSVGIAISDWFGLLAKIHEVAEVDPALDGIVVTHGTATLEETAYFLHLTLKVDLPVVLTGAMRPPNGLSTDSGLNLVNAVRVAASPAAHGLGVLAILNDEIQSARDVTKGANFRVNAFRTRDVGMLGYADPDGTVAIYRRSTRRHAPDTEFDVRALSDLPAVDIVYGYAFADGYLVEALIEKGVAGIVLASLPPGQPTPDQRAALEEAVRRDILVVRSSRAGTGRVLPSTRNDAAGFVAADDLSAQKARVLAMLALTVTRDVADIRRIFREY